MIKISNMRFYYLIDALMGVIPCSKKNYVFDNNLFEICLPTGYLEKLILTYLELRGLLFTQSNILTS